MCAGLPTDQREVIVLRERDKQKHSITLEVRSRSLRGQQGTVHYSTLAFADQSISAADWLR